MKKATFLAGATFGALIGTGAALLLTSKTGIERRKDAQKLVSQITQRLMKEAEKQGLTREQYHAIIDTVVAGYTKNSRLTKATATKLAADLKTRWAEINRELQKAHRDV
ncbi:MAG: YtxH domain-containing protein [bacterium]|nr:YtxH domain-containing protein [bacterium]